MYKVVQIWQGLMSPDIHTNSPGHIWTTLYYSHFLTMYCFHNLTLKIRNGRWTFKLRVRAEISVITQFCRGKLHVKHSFKYSELSRHRRGSIHLRYIELIGICWPGDGEWPFVSVTWKVFKHYLVLQKKLKFVTFITSVYTCMLRSKIENTHWAEKTTTTRCGIRETATTRNLVLWLFLNNLDALWHVKMCHDVVAVKGNDHNEFGLHENTTRCQSRQWGFRTESRLQPVCKEESNQHCARKCKIWSGTTSSKYGFSLQPAVDNGTNVVVRVPDLDRGRLSPRNVLAVVVDVNSTGFYLLGTKEGLLERLYARN